MSRLVVAVLFSVATASMAPSARADEACDSGCYPTNVASFLPTPDDVAPLNTRVFADDPEATTIVELGGTMVELETIDLDGEAHYLVPTEDLLPETVYLVTDDAGVELSRFETGTERDDEAPTGELSLTLYGSCASIVDVDASLTNASVEEGIVIEIRDRDSGELMVVLPERSDEPKDDRWMTSCFRADAQTLNLVVTAYDLAGNALSVDEQWNEEEDRAAVSTGCQLAGGPGGVRGTLAWLLLAAGTSVGWRLRRGRRRHGDRA